MHSLMLGPSPGAKARGTIPETGVNTGHESIYVYYIIMCIYIYIKVRSGRRRRHILFRSHFKP